MAILEYFGEVKECTFILVRSCSPMKRLELLHMAFFLHIVADIKKTLGSLPLGLHTMLNFYL